MRALEIIVREVEVLKMMQGEERIIGKEGSVKHAAREVQCSDLPVTPSHEQQSVPSFHDSVLGCWQRYEAELLMEKDSLNWSKERLWSGAQR
ncbi:hypothetical protein NC651_027808 [Populus alba x Populus x berolinensis]|nr:hypothetical protein NC651_027808 [Populus alba x Populus x berolinensis]